VKNIKFSKTRIESVTGSESCIKEESYTFCVSIEGVGLPHIYIGSEGLESARKTGSEESIPGRAPSKLGIATFLQ
jgi:hypothetical protein